jgi:hypothetical protein
MKSGNMGSLTPLDPIAALIRPSRNRERKERRVPEGCRSTPNQIDASASIP